MSVFTMFTPEEDNATSLPLLCWQAKAVGGGRAFDTGGAPTPMLGWRVALPAGAEAGRALAEADAELNAAEMALPTLERRAARLVAPAALDFSVSAGALPAPEAMFRQRLRATAPVSFGEFAPLAEVQDAFTRLLRAFTYAAWVESQYGGQMVARTTVAWTGGYQTVWQQPLTPSAMQLHPRAVQLALRSRHLLLEMLQLAFRIGAKVAQIASSGGLALLLPSTWFFIMDVVHEIREFIHASQGVTFNVNR